MQYTCRVLSSGGGGGGGGKLLPQTPQLLPQKITTAVQITMKQALLEIQFTLNDLKWPQMHATLYNLKTQIFLRGHACRPL